MPPTPAIQSIASELEARWPQLRYEFYNLRHINSNRFKPWSQHAGSEPAEGWYGNAVDIYDTKDNYDSVVLDQVNTYLHKHRVRLRLNQILWKIPAHHNHIHADTWPKMKDNWWYKPPGKDGTLVTINPDRTTQNTFAIDQEIDDMETISLGNQGNIVVKLQKGLNGWASEHAGQLEPLTQDGDFGPATQQRLKDFQTGSELTTYTPGVCGGITWGALMEYVPDWIDNHTVTTSGIQTGDRVTIADDGFTFTGTIEEN